MVEQYYFVQLRPLRVICHAGTAETQGDAGGLMDFLLFPRVPRAPAVPAWTKPPHK